MDGRSGEDRDTCGISTPCKTIRKAVAVALASDKQAFVHVAGGQLYLNECSQHGIAMLPNRSLNIEAFGGTPTIDCAGEGRFFLFGPPPPPTPTLPRNMVMNDDDNSQFANSSSPLRQGGGSLEATLPPIDDRRGIHSGS